jgi:hypothetical protein
MTETIKKRFIGSKEIFTAQVTNKKTPQEKPILRIEYSDGTYEYLPEKRFLATITDEPIDASALRRKLLEEMGAEVGPKLYGMLHEYGMRLNEIEPAWSYMVGLANNAVDRANNIMWGVDYADQRTLNQINDILLEHARGAKNTQNDGTSPSGDSADTQDTK